MIVEEDIVAVKEMFETIRMTENEALIVSHPTALPEVISRATGARYAGGMIEPSAVSGQFLF